jgi:hypothetical protein
MPPAGGPGCERVRKRAASAGMSGIYGDAHRGAILSSYLLAAAAVMLAVIGGLLHVWHAPPWLQGVVALVELTAIFLMWALHLSSTTDGWNDAYTDTRILAEALRWMKTLAPLGVRTPLPRLPYYLRQSEDAANPDRMWSIWYLRALLRMEPLRHGPVDLAAARDGIDQGIHDEQRRYHRLNARKHRLQHHSIERLFPRLFALVGLCAALHFVDAATGLHLPKVFELSLFICVGGPALISALHGFASQMELHRLQFRSSSMERLLQERSSALKSLDLSDPTSAEAAWGLAAEALATTTLLMDETTGWSMIYRNADIPIG